MMRTDDLAPDADNDVLVDEFTIQIAAPKRIWRDVLQMLDERRVGERVNAMVQDLIPTGCKATIERTDATKGESV